MILIINPGTEANDRATEVNAAEIARRISVATSATYSRHAEGDRNGWYGFRFVRDGRAVEVDIPGDDPDQVCAGTPWVSRRLYVDGSSWLFGYAMGFINRALDGETE